MSARIVIRVNAGVVLPVGTALLVPLAISWLYGDGSWRSFLLPGAAMIALGGTGVLVTHPPSNWAIGYVSNRDVYLSVTLAWVLAALLGRVPFLLEGTFGSLLDSTFEAMSGFTTTGVTLLSDIEAETPSILLWRGMTQWLGGPWSSSWPWHRPWDSGRRDFWGPRSQYSPRPGSRPASPTPPRCSWSSTWRSRWPESSPCSSRG